MDTRLAALLIVLLGIPILLIAQAYPQVYYVSGYRTFDSGGDIGPDWDSINIVDFINEAADPLRMIAVDYFSRLETEGGTDIYADQIPFDGEVLLYPDYFVVISPCSMNGGQFSFRISKIDYNGYYHEDIVASNANGTMQQLGVKYHYDESMKLIRTIKTFNNQYVKWYDIHHVLDNSGRRIEDHCYSSSDSINWQYYSVSTYQYSDQQLAGNYQFEKYLAYPRPLLYDRGGIEPDYLNDAWILQSITTTHANASGGWYPPETKTYNFAYQNDYFVLLNGYNNAQLVWNSEGLLLFSGGAEGGGMPAMNIYYGHTSALSTGEQVIPAESRVAVFPNPVRTNAKIELGRAPTYELTISTYNLRGQLLKMEQIPPQSKQTNWQATDRLGVKLPNGIYLIKIEGEGFSSSAKIIVMN